MSMKVRLLLEKLKCFVLIVLDEYWLSLSCLYNYIDIDADFMSSALFHRCISGLLQLQLV